MSVVSFTVDGEFLKALVSAMAVVSAEYIQFTRNEVKVIGVNPDRVMLLNVRVTPPDYRSDVDSFWVMPLGLENIVKSFGKKEAVRVEVRGTKLYVGVFEAGGEAAEEDVSMLKENMETLQSLEQTIVEGQVKVAVAPFRRIVKSAETTRIPGAYRDKFEYVGFKVQGREGDVVFYMDKESYSITDLRKFPDWLIDVEGHVRAVYKLDTFSSALLLGLGDLAGLEFRTNNRLRVSYTGNYWFADFWLSPYGEEEQLEDLDAILAKPKPVRKMVWRMREETVKDFARVVKAMNAVVYGGTIRMGVMGDELVMYWQNGSKCVFRMARRFFEEFDSAATPVTSGFSLTDFVGFLRGVEDLKCFLDGEPPTGLVLEGSGPATPAKELKSEEFGESLAVPEIGGTGLFSGETGTIKSVFEDAVVAEDDFLIFIVTAFEITVLGRNRVYYTASLPLDGFQAYLEDFVATKHLDVFKEFFSQVPAAKASIGKEGFNITVEAETKIGPLKAEYIQVEEELAAALQVYEEYRKPPAPPPTVEVKPLIAPVVVPKVTTDQDALVYLTNMRKIYHDKHPQYTSIDWAEEILHLIEDHDALSAFLNRQGYRGTVEEKLSKFYEDYEKPAVPPEMPKRLEEWYVLYAPHLNKYILNYVYRSAWDTKEFGSFDEARDFLSKGEGRLYLHAYRGEEDAQWSYPVDMTDFKLKPDTRWESEGVLYHLQQPTWTGLQWLWRVSTWQREGQIERQRSLDIAETDLLVGRYGFPIEKPAVAPSPPEEKPSIQVEKIGSDLVNDRLFTEGWKPIIKIPRLEQALKSPGTGGASTPELALDMAKREYKPEEYDFKVVSHYALDYRFPFTVFVKFKMPQRTIEQLHEYFTIQAKYIGIKDPSKYEEEFGKTLDSTKPYEGNLPLLDKLIQDIYSREKPAAPPEEKEILVSFREMFKVGPPEPPLQVGDKLYTQDNRYYGVIRKIVPMSEKDPTPVYHVELPDGTIKKLHYSYVTAENMRIERLPPAPTGKPLTEEDVLFDMPYRNQEPESLEQIKNRLTIDGFDLSTLQQHLSSLIKKGDIFEPRPGFYAWTESEEELRKEEEGGAPIPEEPEQTVYVKVHVEGGVEADAEGKPKLQTPEFVLMGTTYEEFAKHGNNWEADMWSRPIVGMFGVKQLEDALKDAEIKYDAIEDNQITWGNDWAAIREALAGNPSPFNKYAKFIIKWRPEDLTWTESAKQAYDIYNYKYTVDELKSMSKRSLQVIVKTKDLSTSGDEGELIDRIAAFVPYAGEEAAPKRLEPPFAPKYNVGDIIREKTGKFLMKVVAVYPHHTTPTEEWLYTLQDSEGKNWENMSIWNFELAEKAAPAKSAADLLAEEALKEIAEDALRELRGL